MLHVGQLQAFLDEEVELLQELKRLAIAKKDALLTDDLQELEKIVFQEEFISKKLHSIEKTCSQQVRFYLDGAKKGVKIPESIATRLERIRDLVLAVKEENTFNQTILQDFLGLTRFMINALTSAESDPATYKPTGKIMNNQNKQTIVDFKG